MGLGEGNDPIQAGVGTSGEPEDVADGHEEGVERVGGAHSALAVPREVGQQGAARSLEHVVGHVEDPEPDDKHGDRPRLGLPVKAVAEGVAEICGEADEEDGNGDEGGAGGDERTPTAEPGGAAVAVVADDWLDQHAGDGATEPDEGGPGVWNAEELNVRGQQGELKGPTELDSGGN